MVCYGIYYDAPIELGNLVGYSVCVAIMLIASIVSLAASKSFNLVYKIINAIVFVYAAIIMFVLGGVYLVFVGIFYLLAAAIPFFMTKAE